MKRIITIKKELKDISKELKTFLEDNMRYRRHLYNKGVEYIRSIDHIGFNAYEWDTMIHNTYENTLDDYEDRCVGIRSQVAKDLHLAVEAVWRDRKGKNSSKIPNPNAKCRFKKYNPYEGSFKVVNKHSKTHNRMCTMINSNTLYIKCNKLHHFTINTTSPIYKYECIDNTEYKIDKSQRYMFTNEDIREFGFLKHNKKYYIILVISVSLTIYNIPKKRKKMLGIDLGIHNPLYVYGKNVNTSIRMSIKELMKIDRLELRASKLNTIMSRKYTTNKKLTGNGYSKNYNKVRLKYRLTWNKIYNIRKNWRYKISHYIVNNYKNVCVDTFKQPKSNKVFNHVNRLHAMYLFTDTLRYMCDKYECNFIESPPKSTRTCSNCGYVNDKLDISKRRLKCKCCNIVIDRDENAARNCYHWGKSLI